MLRHARHVHPVSSGLSAAATAWMDRSWDPDVGLLWNMEGSFDELAAPRSLHLVPQSAWYVVGLLARRADDDVERARRTIAAVAATQYDEPATVWHGTLARFHEWPHPPDDAREWVDYDPNWRQFVGTTFALVLADHADALDAPTIEVMRRVIELAVEGEPDGRVPASYSNIALMKSWLDVEAGRVAEGRAVRGGDRRGLPGQRCVPRVRLTDVLRHRPVRAGALEVAVLVSAAAGVGRGDRGRAVARHRSLVSRRSPQPVRPVCPRLRHGHDVVRGAARPLDLGRARAGGRPVP